MFLSRVWEGWPCRFTHIGATWVREARVQPRGLSLASRHGSPPPWRLTRVPPAAPGRPSGYAAPSKRSVSRTMRP